jgi:hypothetical protein
MHPPDCPAWEYAHLPRRAELLTSRTESFLVRLRTGLVDTAACISDSRVEHAAFFEDLTPHNHPYFAGHYRGEPFRCLRYYEVGVHGDPSVGCPAHLVESALADVARLIARGLAALDADAALPIVTLSDEDKLLRVVTFACGLFEFFLRIHPYANGNGHISRLIIWCVLARYGYWPVRFPIEPRPTHPRYCDLIQKHRNGDREALEQFVLQCIAG